MVNNLRNEVMQQLEVKHTFDYLITQISNVAPTSVMKIIPKCEFQKYFK